MDSFFLCKKFVTSTPLPKKCENKLKMAGNKTFAEAFDEIGLDSSGLIPDSDVRKPMEGQWLEKFTATTSAPAKTQVIMQMLMTNKESESVQLAKRQKLEDVQERKLKNWCFDEFTSPENPAFLGGKMKNWIKRFKVYVTNEGLIESSALKALEYKSGKYIAEILQYTSDSMQEWRNSIHVTLDLLTVRANERSDVNVQVKISLTKFKVNKIR